MSVFNSKRRKDYKWRSKCEKIRKIHVNHTRIRKFTVEYCPQAMEELMEKYRAENPDERWYDMY